MSYTEFQNLNLSDDFLFAKVMEDEAVLRPVVEKILDIRIREMTIVQSQRMIEIEPDSKGIRLDIMADDVAGSRYTVEMQNENEYNINIGENVTLISINSLQYTFKNSYKHNPIFNITIKGDNKRIHIHAFDFASPGINSKIHNLTIDSTNVDLESPMICVGGYIDNVSLKCDLNYFTSLFLSGDVIKHNLLKGSNLTIKIGRAHV